MNNEPLEQGYKDKSQLKLLIIAVILITLICFLLYTGLTILTGGTQYYLFTKARTERMEERFNITVTDDVKLLRYEGSSSLICVDEYLTLEVEDYEQFIHNNVNTNVEIYTPYSTEEGVLYYKYVNRRTAFEISPSENKGKYVVTLHHWE